MSWIKENKFAAALAGGTVVASGLLYFVGTMGTDKYEQAKTRFDAAAAEAAQYERLPLYPKAENRDGKRKALDEYKKSLEELQAIFQPFRVEIKNTTGQAFTADLLAAHKEVRAALDEAGATVPEPFFVGFEKYRTAGAPDNTTGILEYQLGAVKKILLDLAKARPTALKNVYRPTLPEEEGQTFADANSVLRRFPLEITFTGSEKSVREFFTALNKPDKQFAIIRSLRIVNMKKDPPRASDAKFETAAAPKPAGAAFVLPGDPTFPVPDAPVKPEAPPAPASSTRILAQVLGDEELAVFVRLDVLQFLPVKKLP